MTMPSILRTEAFTIMTFDTKRHLPAVLLLALGYAFVACGGEAAIGEACDTSGSTEECEEGAVCDTVTDEDIVCLKQCLEQEDCTDDEECNGVSGTNLKACHPKDETPQ
jgi:hypothetical protein